MRISDWSSDVCSSDLHRRRLQRSLAMTAAALGRGAQRALEARIAELERENAKMVTLSDALIRQVDRSHAFTGNHYKPFQSVAELEARVEKRIQQHTHDIGRAPCRGRERQ